jgi:hypothetical protein
MPFKSTMTTVLPNNTAHGGGLGAHYGAAALQACVARANFHPQLLLDKRLVGGDAHVHRGLFTGYAARVRD